MEIQLIRNSDPASGEKMTAEIGHELNNFLGAIQANIELIGRYINHQQYHKVETRLKSVMSSLKNANRFVNDLMNIDDAKTRLNSQDINAAIKNTVRFIKPQSRYKRILFKMELDENLPEANIDEVQLEQLLYNLLGNAADAISESGPGIGVINIKSVFQIAKNSIRISISDTGCGISRENMARLFKIRFTTKPNGHGHGLLSCKKIVDEFGGTISVKSKYGAGTTFDINLPLNK